MKQIKGQLEIIVGIIRTIVNKIRLGEDMEGNVFILQQTVRTSLQVIDSRISIYQKSLEKNDFQDFKNLYSQISPTLTELLLYIDENKNSINLQILLDYATRIETLLHTFN